MVPTGRDGVVRLRMDVSYDGRDFSGWAVQPGRRTVQGVVEAGLETILRLSTTRLTAAGRTDAGVHARGQVCHADVPQESFAAFGPSWLVWRLARLLPADVVVRRVTVAPDGFDARFSAIWRRYAYRLCDDVLGVDPLMRRHVVSWPRRLDEVAMNAAADLLLGEHDFAAFCRRREGATTIRTLRRFEWRRAGHVLTAWVEADAFCHTMVRSMVGAMVAVGEGRRLVGWPTQVLKASVRDPGVTVAAPAGLTLEEVGYPAEHLMQARAVEARAMRTSR